jgi:acetolactate synthase-1/2/3 large subunit
MSSARAFLQTLVGLGVHTAFGIPGGAASPLFDALRSVEGLKYVATRHEAGAAFAAIGHARATGLPSLVLTTSGPGVTNTLTALASAHAEEAPMILVSGEVPLSSWGRGALQDGTAAGWRALDVVRPLTRWCGTLHSTSAAPAYATQAFALSTGAWPGPVFVSVPLDVGSSVAEVPAIHVTPLPEPRPAPVSLSACRLLSESLRAARRPLLLLGAGARGAAREAVALAERLGMPVAVTAHAKGTFPERHPLYLGVIGLGQHPSVDRFLEITPDVSLVVGSGLDDLATNGWSLPLLGTSLSFQVDRDVHALGRSLPFTHLIVGDAATVLGGTAKLVPSDAKSVAVTTPFLSRLRPELERSDAIPLKPPRVLRALADAFPHALWCCDIGEHLAWALHYLQVDGPDDFHDFLGFGSMGSGIGAAIGLQLACPERTVVCVCGDGGLAMMLGELITSVEQRLPIVFAVMNDGRWNMVEHGFRTVYGAAPAGFASTLVDFSATAHAVGGIGICIQRPEDLDPDALAAVARVRRPVVLDIRIDPSEALTPGTRAASIRHFCVDSS